MSQTESKPIEEAIPGVVVDTIFYREENGFRVLKVDPDGPGHSFVASGAIGEIDHGEHVVFYGKWVHHPRFGKQYKVDRYEIRLPDSLEGIERYLGSGMIPGIGPKFAARIVKHFGTETLQVLDNEPMRLREVKGLGKNKYNEIVEFWGKKERTRQLMLFLGEHGIGFNLGLKIQKAYGEQALRQLKNNPYRLVQDVRGVGFISADRIALRIGLAHESPERLRCCLFYVLQRASEDGHTYWPREELLYRAEQLIHVDQELIARELDQLIRDHHLYQFEQGVQLPSIHRMEKSICHHIMKLARTRSGLMSEPSILKQCLQGEMELSSSQASSLSVVINNRFSILTGGPGVGKTTLVKILVKYVERLGLDPQLAAPTGRAAQRMEEATGKKASTLHRLLKFRPDGEGHFTYHENNPLPGRFFIIDEVSMVDIFLFHAFISALPPDAHVVLVGDKDQLPSVGPGRVLGDMLESGKIPVAVLDKVFRQAEGSLLVRNSHRILKRKPPEEAKAGEWTDFYFIEAKDPESTLSYIDRLLLERIPNRFDHKTAFRTQILCPMKRGPLGTIALNEHLQKLLNPNGAEIEFGETSFKVGDRVIQMVNNYDVELYNGDLGEVIDRVANGLRIRFDQKEIIYPVETLSDLSLAYACTVHKSQGSEYPIVIMPIYSGHQVMLSLELLYTALTRAKTMCIWVGQRSFLKSVLLQPSSYSRYTFLKDLLMSISS